MKRIKKRAEIRNDGKWLVRWVEAVSWSSGEALKQLRKSTEGLAKTWPQAARHHLRLIP
jgi:hypothetical protein